MPARIAKTHKFIIYRHFFPNRLFSMRSQHIILRGIFMLCCTSQMFLCLPILWRYWRVPVPLCHCCFRSQSFCGTLKWGYPCVYVRVLPHCLCWLFQFQLYICASSWESQNVACLLAHPCSAIQNNPRTDLRVFTSWMSRARCSMEWKGAQWF